MDEPFDYDRPRSVIRGPFHFFDNSFILEVLDTGGEDSRRVNYYMSR